MKNLIYKSIIILILIHFLNLVSFAQNKNWSLSDSMYNANGNEMDYNSIHCIDSNNCAAVYNIVYLQPCNRFTTNGGKTWQTTLMDTTIFKKDSAGNSRRYYQPSKANCMSYPDTNLCVIGCDSGYYWVSRDNNRTWEKKRLPLNLEIYKISMADSKYGGIQTFDYTKQRNSELYFTNDSCKTWKLIPITLKDTSIKTIAIVNLSIIDSVNFKVLIVKRNDTSNYFMYFELIETKDGGITWELNNTDNNEFLGAQSMLFLSKNTGFIACAVQRARLSSQCSSVVYRTLDGGITWSKVLEQLDKNMVGLRTISFADTLSGVAMGPFGNLWRTTNGGNSWIWAAVKFDSYDNYDFVDISMPTPYIMFGADNWNGKIFKYDANIYTDIPKKDELKDDILIYPNPIYTGQDINIKLNLLYPENIKFELINSLGNIVDASNEMFLDSGSHTINFNARANLLDGVYWLKIIKNGTDIIFKAFVILK